MSSVVLSSVAYLSINCTNPVEMQKQIQIVAVTGRKLGFSRVFPQLMAFFIPFFMSAAGNTDLAEIMSGYSHIYCV